MKLVSMFFTASAENLRALAQSINKRARNTKLASVFFTASAVYLRALAQSTNKRERNTKLASVFFTVSTVISKVYLKVAPKGVFDIQHRRLYKINI